MALCLSQGVAEVSVSGVAEVPEPAQTATNSINSRIEDLQLGAVSKNMNDKQNIFQLVLKGAQV